MGSFFLYKKASKQNLKELCQYQAKPFQADHALQLFSYSYSLNKYNMLRKILFCDNSLYELLNFRGEVINYYANNDYQVVLVAPQTQEYISQNPNIRYIPVRLNRSGMNPLSEWLYFKTLYKIYKKERPDYIFHYTIKPNIYGTLAAKVCHIPSTVMIAGLGYVFNRKGIGCTFARILYKFSLRFTEKVLVLNLSNKNFLQTHKIVSPSRIIHLKGGEGINLNRYIPNALSFGNNKTTFLMIARLLYDKGYDEYTQAARFIKKQYPDTEFQLLGKIDTAYPNHVPETQVRKDHLEGIVNYLGFSSDVIPKIQTADCIILPSYHEGMSRVLIEALAMGKPIITTDIPGCREAVDNGKNGFIIPPKNSRALIAAIEKFINTAPIIRAEMGRYGRQKAEKEFNITQVLDIYKEITTSVRH